jgi:energy-coupling factor transporter ATP-binding protein EcfA2
LVYLQGAIRQDCPEEFVVRRSLIPSGVLSCTDEIFDIIEKDYLEAGQRFAKDFGQAQSLEVNLGLLLGRLWPYLGIPQTILVPSQRMILQSGNQIPQFGQIDFPGNKIQLNSIVNALAQIDRPFAPPDGRNEARKRLSNICRFIAYCLEVEKVEINIPNGQQTIYVTIDGNEQPISNLGSGIEQLIVIGMGSFIFPGQLVLIDEPEIHFHPRTQKHMMQFLNEHADAKFVVATHSSAILDSVDADIVQIHQQEHKCTGTIVRGSKDRYDAVRNLGHSPSELVLANFVIWVEGPSDRIYINHFIGKLDSKLTEGIDYAIIFYGGSILARHEFEDSERDFVKALSIARNFAVYMDSDKQSESDELKGRVVRVSSEVAKNGGIAWVSNCREIENYIPSDVLSKLDTFECNDVSQYGRVVKAKDFDKVKFAEKSIASWADEWPFDLKDRCQELVDRIRQAR